MDKSQLLRAYNQRKKQLHKGMVSKMIRSVNPEQDSMTLDGPEGISKAIPIQHPFISLDSWIRSVPSKGSGVRVLPQLAEDNDIIQGYYYPNRDELIENYRSSKTNTYRPLQPGEHEISSSGHAQSFFSARGRYETRGGLINSWLDNDDLESGTHAPTHTRKLHKKFESVVGDEERFGIVKRPESSIRQKYIKVGGSFAKEYLRFFYDGEGNPLVDHREGNVIDDEGNVTKGHFKKSLRYCKKIYTKDRNKIVFEIDDSGNFSIKLPTDATDGGYLNIPAGKFHAKIDGETKIEAAGNTLIMADGYVEIKVGQTGPTLRMDNKGVRINGHYLVYHEFLDYFGMTHLPSTGIGFMSWPVSHNPATMTAFSVQNKPKNGIFKSDKPTIL